MILRGPHSLESLQKMVVGGPQHHRAGDLEVDPARPVDLDQHGQVVALCQFPCLEMPPLKP